MNAKKIIAAVALVAAGFALSNMDIVTQENVATVRQECATLIDADGNEIGMPTCTYVLDHK